MSAGLILGGAVETLGFGGDFRMVGGRARSVATGVLAGISAGSTVVAFGPANLWSGSQVGIYWLPAQFCNGAGETSKILEGGDQLAVADRERSGKGVVGGCECCNPRVIASCGGGQVCNGIDSLM